MTKGQHTRQAIIEQAAQIFNVRGYSGASIDDLLRATNLTKGGIYNHFESKETLALAAYDYAVSLYDERFKALIEGKRNTRDRLHAFIDLFRSAVDTPVLEGGCPLLNTAVEADDTNPALRARAQQTCNAWHQFIVRTITRGMELGDVRPDTNAVAVASVMIASVEGAMMLTRLFADNQHMYRVTEHLSVYVESFLQEKFV